MDKSKIDEVYNRDIGIARLKSLIERLRDPENGCPWDIEQDNKSIRTLLHRRGSRAPSCHFAE